MTPSLENMVAVVTGASRGAGRGIAAVLGERGSTVYVTGPGLIINTIAWAFGTYLGNVLYDTAKAATARLAFGFAHDLRPHNVAAVAAAPGHLGVTETPEYLGRAVAALAGDPEVMRWSGQVLTAGELAREYGFTDIDGTQPEPFSIKSTADGFARQPGRHWGTQ
jgi:NAD(P)-dependent dehydrogenase (short-subunit alcohol dehydrogenase family)